jgi:FlaA1/EpsC-like NDP-sugar epimerase
MGRAAAVEDSRYATAAPAALRCLIVGAGEAGRMICRDLFRIPKYGLIPVGFLDDQPKFRTVMGVRVLGKLSDLAATARKHEADVAIIAIPSLGNTQIERLAEEAAAAGVMVRVLPSLVATLERDARISDLRALDVDSLLGRREHHVVRSASASVVTGRRVLVTGAGGSIGSELCRQIKGFGPASLHLLDHDESNLHRLQIQLIGEALLDSDELVLADIRDADRVRQVFFDVRPEVVFHAAAHKHLPLLERHPCEAVKSNVIGTRNLVQAAMAVGTDCFVQISTDKAADPSSVLGATKRIAEMVLAASVGGHTKFASVRFGNVLGSRGSFLATLSAQIEKGSVVTVTDPEASRFFMTVEEAVGLVIEAASMANGGATFVLDMGEPVRIVDLVRNYAAQVHLGPGKLKIRYTGLRAGEKLNEVLFSQSERRRPTAHPRIWATQPGLPPAGFSDRLGHLCEVAEMNQVGEVRRSLANLLPEYIAAPVPEPSPALGALYSDEY